MEHARATIAIVSLALLTSCGATDLDEPGSRSAPAAATSGSPHENGAAPHDSKRPEKMLRLVLALEGGKLVEISRAVVPNTVGARDPHRRSASFSRALDARGEVIDERGFRLERHRRSETAGPDGEMIGDRIEVDRPVFSIAVPLFAGLETIRIYAADEGGDRGAARLLGEVDPR